MATGSREAAYGGSPEEFDRLYEEYFERVYRFVHDRVDEPELAQQKTRDVFLELVDSLIGMDDAEIAAHVLKVVRRQLRQES